MFYHSKYVTQIERISCFLYDKYIIQTCFVFLSWHAFLRANTSMHQTNSGKSPKFIFTPTFIFCSPICSNNCGVVFFVKIYFSFREMTFFVRPLKYANFTVDITEVVRPHVTNVLDLRYFCEPNPPCIFHSRYQVKFAGLWVRLKIEQHKYARKFLQ